MRFSSSLSSSSDLAVDDCALYDNFTTVVSDLSSLPDTEQPKPQDQRPSYVHPHLQFRNCMFGREDGWMQPSDFSFEFDFSEAPASQEQNYSSNPYDNSSYLYGEQWYPQQLQNTGYTQYSSQQYPSSHRRFASTSSAASGADAQLSHHQPLSYQRSYSPYPGTHPHLSPYQNQSSTWNLETSSPLSTAQHLPTPQGTPKSDASFHISNPRRSRPSTGRDAALAAAHNSVRSALNQQWSPKTYMPLQTQSQIRPFSEMPRTPQTVGGDDADAQVRAAAAAVPKLDRTVSDAQADELYNPATFLQPPTTAPRSQTQTTSYLQPPPTVLQDRLRDANEARSSSPSQPSGQASPWRDPYGDGAAQFHPQNMPMQTAAAMRTRQKAELDAHEMQQHHQKQRNEEPTTVSPKDAFPEQQVAKEDENLPSLFPTDSNQSNSSNVQYAPINMSSSQEYGALTSAPPQAGFTFTAPTVPASAQAMDFRNSYYQQNQPSVQYGPVNGDYSTSYTLPAHLTSMDTTKSDESEPYERSSPEATVERPSPSDSLANGGRYTCPYSDNHGACGARFGNAGDLNKHKRDVHRPTAAVSNGNNNKIQRATAMTQTGPHKCTRINPSTGKPCNTVFSRPYDLTRHEDTIHGEGKKLKCPHCPEEKLFSRNDALTRHLKVVHNANQSPVPKPRGRRQGT